MSACRQKSCRIRVTKFFYNNCIQTTSFSFKNNPPPVQRTFPSCPTIPPRTPGRTPQKLCSSVAFAFRKRVPLMTALNLEKRKNHTELGGEVGGEAAPVQRCSSRPETAECWGRCELCLGETDMSHSATSLASFHALSKANAAESLYRHTG